MLRLGKSWKLLMDKFVHLRVHSEFSLVDGLGRVKTLPVKAHERGLPALAITDVMNFYGAVKFYRACSANGVKPIIGLDVAIRSEESAIPEKLVLLCKNNDGFKFLNHVLTRAYTSPRTSHILTIDLDWLKGVGTNVIALSGGIDGALGRALISGQEELGQVVLDEYRQIFGDQYYIDVHRVGLPREEEYFQRALHLGAQHSVPVLATNAVQFYDESEFDAHDVRVCINEGRVLNDPRRVQRFTKNQYLRDGSEMKILFPENESLLTNTLAIAKQCNVFMDFNTSHMPAYPTRQDVTADGQLRIDSETGLQRRIDDIAQVSGVSVDRATYDARLEIELEVIVGMGFAGYFLIVADFIAWAKQQDIPVGPGRGSGAGSLIAWSLGITDLDPIHYGLLFERFLNPERVSLPDFDIDFCMDRRDEVIEYVANRYGRDRVSQIITYGTMAAKAVVRDVGRVMGHPYGYVDSLAKMVPFEIGITLEKALNDEPALQARYDQEEEIQQLIDAARLLEGLPRNVGKHAGGVVIAPNNIAEYVSLYMEPGMSQPVTQYDKDDLETIGLVKFDFLGLRTLTVIHNAIKLIETTTQQKIDINSVALNDSKTFELIKSGKTTGVFQLESRGMQEIILRLLPDKFDDLIALVALFRPGPLQSGMVDDFINRKHGRERIEYPHSDLEEILEPTYGVILYQEQVMQIAQVLSGYTLGAADLLRRAMGKKKIEEMEKQRTDFVVGASSRGVDPSTSGGIFDLVEKFAGYGFNKSHSAAYALLTYQTAWLKTHFPAEFMAASLTADMEHTDKVVTLISETRSLGLEVHAPSVNHCDTQFTPVHGEAIYYGLGALKGVGQTAVELIVEERKLNGAFTSIFDLCHRIDSKRANKRVFDSLIRGGALDCLGENRASSLLSLRSALELASKKSQDAQSGQNDLFGVSPSVSALEIVKSVPEWPEGKRLKAEKDVLGLYLTGHPFLPLREELSSLSDSEISTLKPASDRDAIVTGLVSQIRIMKTKKGNQIAFLLIDDSSGRMEVSVFSKLFAARRHLIQQDVVLILRGATSVDDYTGNIQMRANDVFEVDQARSNWLERIEIVTTTNSTDGEHLEWLQSVLVNQGGTTKVTLHICRPNGDVGTVRIGAQWRLTLTEDVKEELEERFGKDKISYRYDRSAALLAEFESSQVAA
jgi:DNA polymerase III subunit alpha